MRLPAYLFDRANHKNPRERACEQDHRSDSEGPEKMSGALDHKSSDCRRRDARKVSDKILNSSPFACGVRAGKRLRNGPKIGSAKAKRNAGDKEEEGRQLLIRGH